MSKREVLLKALVATPGDLERLVRGMENTAVNTLPLYHRPAADTWSTADVLCHLTLVEEGHQARLQLVMAEIRPLLPIIHPNAAAHDLTQTIPTMLRLFRQARQATLAFLQDVKAGDWQRTAVHPTRGDMTFRALIQFLVDHDTAHLNQIIEIQTNCRA